MPELKNSCTFTLVSEPPTPATKPCATQVVPVVASPVVLAVVCCWSTALPPPKQ
ncbi:MAG TPA: hypothetical protein VE713_10960 [Pyrinomonadaceae bacterium]|nr:hypothetical protein [Pyrinomonadaceae bacterium]